MNVLMLSLGADIFDAEGATLARHRLYARHAGRIRILAAARGPVGVTPWSTSSDLSLTRITAPSHFQLMSTLLRLALRSIRVERPELVVAQEPFLTGSVALMVARRWRLPFVVNNHSAFFRNPYWLAESPLRNRLLLWLGKSVIHKAILARVVNAHQRDVYLGWGLPAERVRLLPTPMNLDPFITYQRPMDSSSNLIVWAGSASSKAKALPVLLRAFRIVLGEFPLASLALAGVQPQDLALPLGDPGRGRIQPLGWVPHGDLPKLFARAELYAQSSRYEGLPKAVVEAAAAGLPVAATAAIGVDEVVQHGRNGLLSPVEDASGLAHSIGRLLRDPKSAGAMGQEGRDRVAQRFHFESMIRSVVQLWLNAVEQGAGT